MCITGIVICKLLNIKRHRIPDPWNEIEAGNNYARSMATYALLNTFSGFQFDMVRGMIGFNPIQPKDGRFRCFWSLDSGWGEFKMEPSQVELCLYYGHLCLQILNLPFIAEKKVESITLEGRSVDFIQDGGKISFKPAIQIDREQSLLLKIC